jgi:hypothetical protein
VTDSRFAEVFSRVEVDDSGTELSTRSHDSGAPAQVYTLSLDDGPYRVTARGVDAFGDTVCTQTEVFELNAPGQDRYYVPPCPGVSLQITLAEFAERGVPTPVLVRAGIIDENGDQEFKAGIELLLSVTGGSLTATTGTTAADGFFDTEATINASAEQMIVFVTATDPATSAETVASATAQPIESGGNTTIVLGNGSMVYSSKSSAVVSTTQDSDFRPISATIPDQLTHGGSVSTSATASEEMTTAKANADATADFLIDLQNGDSLMVVTADFQGVAHGEAFGPLADIGSATGDGSAIGQMAFEFTVVGDPVPYLLRVSIVETGGDQVGGSVNTFFLLEDEDRNRIEIVSEGDVSSSGVLAPGTYTFRARGSAAARNISDSGAIDTATSYSVYFALF